MIDKYKYGWDDAIPISDDEVVFIKSDCQTCENQVWLYNLEKDAMRALPIRYCKYPMIWRSATQQLVCLDAVKDEYFLTDLDGKNIEYLFHANKGAPMLYIAETDQVLIRVVALDWSQMAEVFSVQLYDFKQKKILGKIIDPAASNTAVLYFKE